jgi:hypothetical protein
VSSGFGPRPSAEVGSSAVMCPVVPYGPRGSNIKKNLADLFMKLGMNVPNARAHVFKTPDIRAIMGL